MSWDFNFMAKKKAAKRKPTLKKCDSEQRLRLILEATSEGFWDWNIIEDECYWTDNCFHSLGRKRGDLQPTMEGLRSIFHPEDRSLMQQVVQAPIDDDAPFDFECRMQHKDGSYRWFRSRGRVLRDEWGRPYRMIGANTDITDHKQVHASLQESQRTLSTVVSNLRGAAYRCRNDRHRTMEYISDGMRGLTGHSAADLMHGKVHVGDVIHPEDRQRVWDTVQKSLAEKKPFQLDYRIIHVDGEVKCVWEQGQGVFSSEGELVALEGLITDITEQKRSEAALRESEARSKGIVQTAAEGIITMSADRLIESVNPAAEKMFGYREDELIGKNVKILMPPDYANNHDRYVANYLKTGKAKIIGIGREVVGRRKDGTSFPIALSVSEVRLLESRVFTGLIRDISERRELEQQIVRAADEEQQRIAQDLHDGLGSHLGGLGFLCRALAEELKASSSPQARDAQCHGTKRRRSRGEKEQNNFEMTRV